MKKLFIVNILFAITFILLSDAFSEQTKLNSFFESPFDDIKEYIPDIKLQDIDSIYTKIGKPDFLIHDKTSTSNSTGETFPYVILIYKNYYLSYIKITNSYLLTNIWISNNNLKLKFNIKMGLSLKDITSVFGDKYFSIKDDELTISYSVDEHGFKQLLFDFKSDKLIGIRIHNAIE